MTKEIEQLFRYLLKFEPTLTKSLSELKVVQENKPKVENNIPEASQKTKKMAKTNMNSLSATVQRRKNDFIISEKFAKIIKKTI